MKMNFSVFTVSKKLNCSKTPNIRDPEMVQVLMWSKWIYIPKARIFYTYSLNFLLVDQAGRVDNSMERS